MKKNLLLFLPIFLSFSSFSLKAQDVQLYRTATDNATVQTFTFPSGDVIDYGSAVAPSSSTLCGLAGQRVQVNTVVLTIKSTSVSKIVVQGVSSGATSARYLGDITVGSTTLVRGTDYTTSSTIVDNATCAYIEIDLNSTAYIPLNTSGTNVTLTFSSVSTGPSSSPQNVKMSEIDLTPIITTPLDFTSFSAKADALGKSVALNWSTTNELNTKNFEIQRKADNGDFKTIGELACSNTPGNHNYAFADAYPISGNSYYRVLEFDLDGASKSSAIQAVNIKSAVALSIYPNPVGQNLSVDFPSVGNHAKIRILGMDGKLMFVKSLDVNSSNVTLDVSGLSKGAYMLLLDDGESTHSQKFIKQ